MLVTRQKRVANRVQKPFSASDIQGEGVSFSFGAITPIYGQFQTKEPENLGEPVEIGEKKEFYLRIEFKPLTNEIEEIKIVNDEELKESAKNTDAGMVVVIPLARLSENELSFNGEQVLNSNLNLARDNIEVPLQGYFKDGKVYLASAPVFASSGRLYSLIPSQELEAKDGDTICVAFSGNENSSNTPRVLNVGSLGFIKKSKDGVNWKSFVDTFGGTKSESVLREFSIEYPIGLVKGGNYIPMVTGGFRLVFESSPAFLDFSKMVRISEFTGEDCFVPEFSILKSSYGYTSF
jgi:hypothetical protein